MNELYSVFEREGAQVGIGEFGESRALIHVSGGALEATKVLSLSELGPYIAALKRSGFSMNLKGAFFDSVKNKFGMRHPDFLEKTYFVFIREKCDVQAAVARMQEIGLMRLSGPQRESFKDWLRCLDLSENYLVADDTDPVFTLVLSEYAHEASLCVYAAIPGLPAVRPSCSKQIWCDWLKTKFGEEKVRRALDSLWPAQANLPTREEVHPVKGDFFSYQF